MAKPNYSFEKRQRDLEKKRKQEEKRQRKLAEKAADKQSAGSGGDASDLDTSGVTDADPQA